MKRVNKDSEALRYKRQFWKSAARHLPHHSLLVISARIKAPRLTDALSKRRDDILRKSIVKTYPTKLVEEYQGVMATTKLWHGAGRLQYKNKRVYDAFEAIIGNGALRPAKDVYAIILGGEEMTSISTTPLRIIARSYADMHGEGEREKYRYGSALWWVAYYYGMFYGIVFTRYSLTIMRNWSKWNNASTNDSGQRTWGHKVNAKADSVWSAFGQGSDIPGNYPVLFGIKQYSLVAKMPHTLQKVETRLTNPVQISDLSHIEVPEDKIDEVKARLATHGFSTPVFPIELGEYVASKQQFKTLLGIK